MILEQPWTTGNEFNLGIRRKKWNKYTGDEFDLDEQGRIGSFKKTRPVYLQ